MSMRPSAGSGLTSLSSHPAGSAGVQYHQVPALRVRQLPLPCLGRGLGHPHGSPLLPDDSRGHGGGCAPRRRDAVGGRRCWGPSLLGRTPEMCRDDHNPLPSPYPGNFCTLSPGGVCPHPSLLPMGCERQRVPGHFQQRPFLQCQAGTGSRCFPRGSPVNIPVMPCPAGKYIDPSLGRAWTHETLYPFCRSHDRARKAAIGPCRQHRQDPSAERLSPGAGYGAAGCPQPSQPWMLAPGC